MQAIVTHIRWIMIVSGAITCTMIINTVNPELGLQQMFGASTFAGGADSQVANIVVRGWGFLIALIGAMLMYAANKPALRAFALSVASISKLAFIALVLTYGSAFMANALPAILFDTVIIVIFVVYLLSSGKPSS